jgi:hypothetical protein
VLEDAVLAPAGLRREAVERAWANLVGPGPLLSAAERHQVIRDARAAWAGAALPNPASGVRGEAAHWLAMDAEGLRAEYVEDFEARGLGRLRYLEIVGIVGRLANVDFYVRGLGATELPLPEPSTAAPTGIVDPAAVVTNMWVPTIGQTFAPHVVDALPAEGEAVRDIHEPMYMQMSDMGDNAYSDELTRAQIEYLAARTSYLNECFY